MQPPPLPDKTRIPAAQPASSATRSTHVPSTSSHRNAGGGLPPLPPPPAPAPAPAAQAGLPDAQPAAGPSKPVNRPAASKNAIIHSVLQRRNPILPLIRNVGLEIGDIVADYQVGAHSGVLFLSLKYHRLHPEYIFGRIEKMRNVYNLRILLILCDISEHQQPIRELSKVAVVNDMTTIVAFSNEEAAQYLTTYKAYEHKSADSLKERIRQTYPEQLEHVLTSGRKVNKANAETLAATFGSFANMARQSSSVLTGVKGIGPTKTLSLYRAFNEPFVAGGRSTSDKSSAPSAFAATDNNSADPAVGTMSTDADPSLPEADLAAEEPPASVQPGSSSGRSPTTPTRSSPPSSVPEGLIVAASIPRVASLARPDTPRRPDDMGPSRSPSVGPEDEEHTATKEVWHDPLADDDDDVSGAEDDRQPKRQRVE